MSDNGCARDLTDIVGPHCMLQVFGQGSCRLRRTNICWRYLVGDIINLGFLGRD